MRSGRARVTNKLLFELTFHIVNSMQLLSGLRFIHTDKKRNFYLMFCYLFFDLFSCHLICFAFASISLDTNSSFGRIHTKQKWNRSKTKEQSSKNFLFLFVKFGLRGVFTFSESDYNPLIFAVIEYEHYWVILFVKNHLKAMSLLHWFPCSVNISLHM